ncbi:MAG: transporter substrate-binding domain-containing protein, partial [Bacteriovoracaceae bacterium]|nr:transporter substrate-binding domain-containing protein [Bacteriovoracaceae bacterium]
LTLLLRLLIVSIFLSPHIEAAKALHICTYKLPGNMVTPEKKGFIIDLLHFGLGQDYELKLNLLPPVRAFENFQNDKCDILATHMEKTIKDKNGNPYSVELPTGLEDYLTVFFINKKSTEKFYSDHGKRIVAVKQWNIPRALTEAKSLYSAMSLKGAVKMLQAGRADYLVGFHYLIQSYISKYKLENIVHDEAIKVDLKSVVLLVNPSKEAQEIKKRYKTRILKSLKDGTYDEIYKRNKAPDWLLQDRAKFQETLKEL